MKINAVLNTDRTLKNVVSVDEITARSVDCPIDVNMTDIFVTNAPPVPDDMHTPRLSLDGTRWEEADPIAAAEKLLSELVENKLSAISNSMDVALATGHTCANGITMDATDADVRKLDDGTRLATRLGLATMDIRDANNVRHLSIPVTDVEAMVTELGLNWTTQWSKKCGLQESVADIVARTQLLTTDPNYLDHTAAGIAIQAIAW
jgi:hypothetical protein